MVVFSELRNAKDFEKKTVSFGPHVHIPLTPKILHDTLYVSSNLKLLQFVRLGKSIIVFMKFIEIWPNFFIDTIFMEVKKPTK